MFDVHTVIPEVVGNNCYIIQTNNKKIKFTILPIICGSHNWILF